MTFVVLMTGLFDLKIPSSRPKLLVVVRIHSILPGYIISSSPHYSHYILQLALPLAYRRPATSALRPGVSPDS